MTLIDQLNQNPLVAIILILVPVIGIVWRVFHALYVKPRDFKINSLTDDLGKLKDELVRLRRDQERQTAQTRVPQDRTIPAPSTDSGPEKTKFPPSIPTVVAERSPLSSLAACYAQWNDESLTKLQKQKFETDYTGKQISWHVQVDSVSEAEHDRIYLYVTELTAGWEHPRACAHFAASQQAVLLALSPGDPITLRGTIKEFFLWPVIEQCQIERTGGAEPGGGHVR